MSRRRRDRQVINTEAALIFFLNACALAVIALAIVTLAPLMGLTP